MEKRGGEGGALLCPLGTRGVGAGLGERGGQGEVVGDCTKIKRMINYAAYLLPRDMWEGKSANLCST